MILPMNTSLNDLLLRHLATVCIVVIIVLRMLELAKKRETVRGSIPEKWTLKLFVAIGYLIAGGAILEMYRLERSVRLVPFGFGIAAAAGSFALRRATIRA